MLVKTEAAEPIANHSGSGGYSIGNTMVSVSSVGQGSPVEWAHGSSYLWQGGVIYPQQTVSASTDSDGDRLTDWQEATGSAFMPVTRTSNASTDSDGDGVSDGEESYAGTDPLNSLSQFEVINQTITTNGLVVEWIARAGQRYDVFRKELSAGATSMVMVATSLYANGVGYGPWQETIQAWTNPMYLPTNGYFLVRKR